MSLEKVYKKNMRERINDILENPDPGHYQKLWMVGFLKFCGYTDQEIVDLIMNESAWEKLDERKTFCQVRSVKRRGGD